MFQRGLRALWLVRRVPSAAAESAGVGEEGARGGLAAAGGLEGRCEVNAIDAKPTIKCPQCLGKGGEMMMTTTEGSREIHFEKCGICHGAKKVNKALLEAYRAYLHEGDTK